MKKKVNSILLGIARKAYHLLPLEINHRIAVQNFFYKNFQFLFSSTESYKIWELQKGLPYFKPLTKYNRLSSPQLTLFENALQELHLPIAENPGVSIIVPVYGQIDYTLNCLQSLGKLVTPIGFEVIIVDDCSPDNTQDKLKNVHGVKVILNEVNMGFICSCNTGAKQASGEFLVFLNNDTEVLSDWLDALIGTFSDFPTAGLVGSKLLYSDGRLQEAGGIIWNDATGMNFGRIDDPNKPEFNYVRDVDYCSGASIAIRRELFEAVGGFDRRYIPAYYEDTDLAFAVRSAGYRVLYQPASELIHFEGITSGTDINAGIKSYQAVNRLKFMGKWADKLTSHGLPGESVFLQRDRFARGRILIIDETTPTPDQDSGSQDIYYVQKTLIELGYKITFVPENLVILDRYTQQLQQLGVECLYAPYVPTLKNYLKANGKAFDLVILYRMQAASHHFKNISTYCPQAKIIFNTVDLHHLRLEREAVLTGSAEKAEQAKRTRGIEFDLMRKSDMTIVISEAEARFLHQQEPSLRLTVMPFMRPIPGCRHSFAKRKDIIFIGGFNHTPNIDAVDHFVRDIWPLVHASLPEVQFLIIGSKMPDHIKALSSQAGIVAVGYVEELADYFDLCKLTVVPLRFGAGIKGKIGTSAGFGVPCVATTIAVEGMGLVNGEHVLVADEPAAFAELVIKLYQDEPLWMRLSQASLDKVKEEYSLEMGKKRLEKLLNNINVGANSFAQGG